MFLLILFQNLPIFSPLHLKPMAFISKPREPSPIHTSSTSNHKRTRTLAMSIASSNCLSSEGMAEKSGKQWNRGVGYMQVEVTIFQFRPNSSFLFPLSSPTNSIHQSNLFLHYPLSFLFLFSISNQSKFIFLFFIFHIEI